MKMFAIARCKEKTAFEHEGATGKVYLHKGDARNLEMDAQHTR